ncbi:MAG: hypothetical protein KKC46_19585 [Proteobacteria bacterium]|nr:hypothetical protein [Pseudomonadota bacterium]
MKTGVIVCMVGDQTSETNFDLVQAVKNLKINADRVEVVSSKEGHFDVMDACWVLTARGMNRIVCMTCELVSHSELRLTGRELRLCG